MNDENNKINFSRRMFVTTSLTAAVGLIFLKNKDFHWGKPASQLLIQPFQSSTQQGHDYGICFYDLDTMTAKSYPLPFNIHLIEPSPNKPDYLIGATKYGRDFLTYDLTKKEVIKTYKTEDPYTLSGHFAFSNDGKYLCATGFDYKNENQNCLFIFDQTTLKIKKVFSLKNTDPMVHDCRFLPGTHILLATAGQGLFALDCDKETIEETTVLAPESKQQLRHLTISKDSDIVMQANVIKTDGPEWLYTKGALVQADLSDEKTIYQLEKFKPEARDYEILDLAIDAKNNIFAIVHGKSKIVTFWDMKKKTLIKELELNYASRVAVTNDHHFIFITQDKLVYVSTKTLEVIKSVAPAGFPFGAKLDLPHKTLV